MIRRDDRKSSLAHFRRQLFGDGPGLEDAADFQVKIVVRGSRLVPLNDETGTRGLSLTLGHGLLSTSKTKVREPAPGVRLDAPGDAAEQELLVIGSGVLAENLTVLVLELRRGQLAQALDLFSDP